MVARVPVTFLILGALLGLAGTAQAQLNEHCTATIMNRSVRVNANGTFAISDVPVDLGSFRVRVVCKDDDGTVRTFLSDFQKLVPNGQNQIGSLSFNSTQPIPSQLQVVALTTVLTARGQTVQLSVRGIMPDGNARDLTPPAAGTSYSTSNAAIASVTPQGVVTATGRGQAIISARNEGVLGAVIINVSVPNDADNDGMPDEYERANGFNSNDPNDASQDADGDGLTNLQEFQRGTNPRAADTDGDGLLDGQEVALGTNPLRADTDGDGLTDGQEVARGTNPLVADTDGDGIVDGLEAQLGLDPKTADATTTVQGRVVDGGGAPVPGASVLAFGVFTTQTDATGGFSILKVPATLGPITALARIVRNNQLLDGTSSATVAVANGVTDVHTIQVVASAGVVTGLITDPQNRPVNGAQVTLIKGFDRRTTATDLTGRYRFSNAQPGTIQLTVIDNGTGLRGRASGIVPADQPLTANIQLGAFGTISGTVFNRDGLSPVGLGVAVSLSGASGGSTQTDQNGRYTFDFVPLSGFSIDASDAQGNRGRTTGTLTITGQAVPADVAFLARGTVTGLVTDQGNPVGNATVDLTDGSIFNISRSTTTDGQGRYTFTNVFIGTSRVSARSPLTQQGGQASGSLQSESQTLQLNVALAPTGTLTGTVFRAGTPVTALASARVQLSNGRITTANASGIYQFDLVPPGVVGINAADLSTGDRVDSTATVVANQTTTRNVTLNGQAPVTVVVRDGADQLVTGAHVTVNGLFGSSAQGVTGDDGAVSFPRVFVGSYTAHATNPATQLSASTADTAVLGQTTQTIVRLQASGTIRGTVVGPDGVTPVSGISVQLTGQVGRSMFSAANGAFAFAVVPIGTYQLNAYDQFGNRRGFANSISLSTQGQERIRNIQLTGIATVVGTVTDQDDNPVPSVPVYLEGPRNAVVYTNNVGHFSVPGIPQGAFTVSANFRRGPDQLIGSAQGTVTQNGQTVTADIKVSANLIPTTTTLHDANNFEFNLRENGSIQDGTRQVFGGDQAGNRGAEQLEVTVNGTATRFSGQSFGTSENGGRQIGIAQTIGGLDVTRKIFVPVDGYFARYLETFANHTSAPVTFDVRLLNHSRYITKVQNGFRFGREPRLISTSTGDAALSVGATQDHWALLDDDEDLDPFSTNSLPAFAHIWDGPGAPSKADALSFDLFTGQYGLLTTNWHGLTLQPGESLALLHFVVQETTRAAGQAAAERLVQLPPEALTGGTISDLLNSTRQLQSLTQLLATQSQTLVELFAGTANTFQAPASSLASLNNDVTTLVTSLQSIAPTATSSVVRAAALQASQLAQSARQQAAALPTATYCAIGAGVCPTLRSVANATPGLSDPYDTILGTATTTTTRGQELLNTSTNVLDLSSVRNFAVPIAGGSSVAPLPALNGTISGNVLQDVSVGVPSATVTFRSTNTLFDRTYAFTADGNGHFQAAARFVDGNSLPIPVGRLPEQGPGAAYLVRATHPETALVSPTVLGSFPEGFISTTTDILFANAGSLAGVVRRANGAVVSGGSVRITGGGFGIEGVIAQMTVPIGIDGSYGAFGLPSGTYDLLATVPEAQGTPLISRRPMQILVGRVNQADIQIAATGSISGIVRRQGGAAAPGVTVQLRTPTVNRSTLTDTAGRYSFNDVFIELATVEAFDQVTNTAAAAAAQVVADVITPLDLTLTVGGSVTGLVRFGAQPQPNTQVVVQWSDGQQTVATGGDGRYHVDHVTPGPVTVRVQNSNGRGANGGTLGLSGETLTLDVSLFAGGTVTGQVFHAASATPVPDAQVSINRFVPGLPSTVTTDAQGRFTFESVSVGSFRLEVVETATADRGLTTNQVNANNETRTVNVTLNGQGQVTVTVRDASDNLINNAHVTVSSQTQFGGTQQGDTGPNGIATFARVLAGQFRVEATDPGTQLAGSATGSVALNTPASVTVRLQASGSILGRILTPSGIPASNVTARLLSNNFGLIRAVTTLADGSFRFDAVPLGTYAVDVLDSANRLRARTTDITLSSNGQSATRELTMIGLGTVTGRVTRPDDSAASDFPVSLRSLSPIGGYFSVTTSSDGGFEILNVPVGDFVATSQQNQLVGETAGSITQDGQSVVANIALLDNGINLGTYRIDGNGHYYLIGGNGAITDSTSSIFYGDFNQNIGGFLLDIVAGGTPARFTGTTFGTTENAGQEIAVRQQNLAGLNVTRKVFVPQNGYFARFLEEVTNPTASPITVDVRVSTNERSYYSVPNVIRTSSGDTTLSVTDPNNPDRWVVVDDSNDDDAFDQGGLPATAFVFDGASATEHAGAATLTRTGSNALITYRWNNVVIPPGGTVTYMHFGLMETSRASAQAAAERLVQLPPEALISLSGDEIATIRNFAVPSGGVSALAPMTLGGSISGRALEFNGTTPIPSMNVRYQSTNMLYRRSRNLVTNAQGAFSLATVVPNVGGFNPVTIPIEPFTLSGTHPQTGVAPGAVSGTFPTGQTLAVQDVRFTNTAIVSGVVRTAAGTAVTTGGSVRLFRSSPTSLNVFVSIQANGSYVIGGVPPGVFSLTATVSNPQGTGLVGIGSVTTVANQASLMDITLPALGTLTGVISNGGGSPAAGVSVRISASGFSRSTNANGTGQYAFADVPAGSYTLQAFEPQTGIAASATVTIVQNQTTTRDLTLIGLGTLQVQVNYASGAPAGSSQVNLFEAARGYYRFIGYTDAAGRLTVFNVPIGNFTVRAFNPSTNTSMFSDIGGVMLTNGSSVPVTLTLPAVGIVTGRVTNAAGTQPSINSRVDIYDVTSSFFYGSAYTDANGNFTVAQVAANKTLRIRAWTPTFSVFRDIIDQSIPGDGQTLTVDIRMPAFATVRVTVLRSDGAAYANARIDIQTVQNGYLSFAGFADTAGVLNIPDIQEGLFSLRARDRNTFAFAGTGSGEVRQADDGRIVDVTINAPLSGNVTGTVYAGDGATPLPSAYVQVLDAATNETLTADYTNTAGQYTLNGITPGSSGFIVRAHSPANFSVFTDASGSFTVTGETRTVNLTVAVSVLTGTVTFTDGAPVPYPTVFATTTPGGGDVGASQTYYATETRGTGYYLIVGVPQDVPFTVIAQDRESSLTGSAQGQIAAVATPATVDVTMNASGTIRGRVLNASGPVPFTQVALSNGISFNRFGETDVNGAFEFVHVQLGPFAMQACDYSISNAGACGNATGTILNDLDTVVVDVTVAELGDVEGTVTDGITPLANSRVRIDSVGSTGPLGTVSQQTFTAADGTYHIANVQAGPVRVTAFDPANPSRAGQVDATLAAHTVNTVNVAMGNAIQFGRYNLDGSDGFRYDVSCNGSLNDGGSVDRSFNDAYDGSYYLSSATGTDFPCMSSGALEDNGREVVIGPQPYLGVTATRKIFSPAAGGFARYLEVLQNPNSVDTLVSIQVRSNLGSDGSTRVVVAPASTANRYAVTDQNGICCDGSLAHVFAGTGGAIGAVATQFINNNDNIFYRFDVTVPANGTAIVMHFAVQRASNGEADAQAQTLVTLTDPNALAGMTAAERAAVKNFNVPQQ